MKMGDDATVEMALLDELESIDLALLLDIVDDAPSVPLMDPAVSTSEGQSARSKALAARQRQKEELEHLREQVSSLEDELTALRAKVDKDSPTPAGSGQPVVVALSNSEAWKRIATNQLTAKQQAEMENQRLRKQLEGQLKIAKGLEKLLRKRSDYDTPELLDERKRRRRHNSTDDSDVYLQLGQNLQSLYAQYEEEFKRVGLATSKCDVEDTRVQRHPTGDTTIEIVYAKVYPFDFETTSAAVWRMSTMSYVPLACGYYAAKSVRNELLECKFEIPIQVRRQSVTLHVRVAMKRYFEEHHETQRQVHVWDSLSLLRSPQKMFDGIQLLGHGWTVIRELPCDDEGHPVTVVQCWSSLNADEQSITKQSQIGLLSDVLIASYTRNYQSLTEMIENLLLAETLSGGVKQEVHTVAESVA